MHEIRVPRLGWSMEEGTLISWLKQPGEPVAVGEPLFELEGEKATQEIESVDEGILYVPPDSPPLGSVVPVGALVGYLLAPGEPPPASDANPGSGPAAETQPTAATSPAAEVALPPPATRPAELDAPVELAEPVDLTAPVELAERAAGKRVASPRARRVAAELGVDWTTLQGTGQGGRIREADVLAASGSAATPAANGRGGSAAPAIVLSSRRKAIAERLRISRQRTIPVTLTTLADATNLVALRAQFKAAGAALTPAFTDIAACLAAKVLKSHPQMAVRWNPADQTLVAVPEDGLDIGIAVDTPEGLLTPIVRDVAHKPLMVVAREARTLVERARAGRLTAAEMQGGALTITNLGAWNIDGFTPIISYPEIAILGMGAIRREAAVLPDDRIAPRERITLSLTFDHAAIDGAPAAAFLRDLAAALENPAPHLLA